MISLLRRLRARQRLRSRVGLWHHEDYEAGHLVRTGRAPGAGRVDLALGQLSRERLLRSGDVRCPPIASFEDLERAHARSWIEAASEPGTLGRVFGLDPVSLDTDALLAAQRRATGGTLAAARAASDGDVSIAFNLGGGFHHAEPEQGSGMCVFNDIAVAVRTLRAGGYDVPIAIVDLDYHQGNGNVVTFARDRSVLTYSLHGSTWSHSEAEANVDVHLSERADDDDYLERLRRTLPEALSEHRPGLVFYNAGADVLDGDPRGGFALTLGGVLDRDRCVVESARALGARCVITLGGGYGNDAWRCTANLLRWLLTSQTRIPKAQGEAPRERFQQIAASIDPADLQRDTLPVLGRADVPLRLGRWPPGQRLLGYYSAQGVEYAFERYGILPGLRQRGFQDLRLSADFSDPGRQFIRITGHRGGPEPLLLLELILRRFSRKAGSGPPPAPPPLDLLAVEWLLLQDPTEDFSLARPPLPGQEHPGLGIARDIKELLVQACLRLGLDGLWTSPAHYHGAAQSHPEFRFLDPAAEGRFLALREVLSGYAIDEASALVEAGAVRTADGTVIGQPAEHVLPVSAILHEYFRSPAYEAASQAARDALLGAGLHVTRGPRHPSRPAEPDLTK